MALERDVVIRLLGDANSAVAAQRAAAQAAGVSEAAYRRAEREQQRQARAAEEAARRQRAAMEQVGRGATIMGATILAGLGMATKAAIDWETAWTGVTKTVNGTPAQLDEVEKGLRNLAKTLPSTHEEIAAVAEAAGQLGISTDNIVSFTRTMIDLSQTTNLTADEAATALARFTNIMGTPQDKVSNLGASLVALGNAGASTEKEILELATRLASAGHQIGLTEGDVLGIANALSSVGIEAEAGGTAFSKVMLTMRAAVEQGGGALNAFAETAGMTAAQFKQQFKDDAGGAIAAFVKGLSDMEKQGESTQPVLNELGFTDVRVGNALRSSAAAADMFTSSLEMGNKAFGDNTALIQEAAKRYDTTASKMSMAKNALHDAAIEIGEEFLPVLAGVAEKVAAVGQWFSNLPGPVKSVLAGLGSVAGVVGVVGGGLLLLVPRISSTVQAFRNLSATSPRVAAGLRGIGKATAVAASVLLVRDAIRSLSEDANASNASMEATTNALLNMGTSMDDVNKLFKAHANDYGATAGEFKNFAEVASRIADPTLNDRLNDFAGSLVGISEGAPGRKALLQQIDQIGQSLGLMVQSGNADRAKEIFNQLADEWKRGGGTVADLKKLMPGYQAALDGVANDQKEAADAAWQQHQATAALAADVGTAYASLENYAAALGMSDDDAKEFVKNAQDMGQSLADFVTPMETYTGLLEEKAQAEADAFNKTHEGTGAAAKSWEDFADSVHVSLGKYLEDLEAQVQAQQDWQVNMLSLAGRVSQGTLDELARMGPEGAPLVAQLVNASDAELARFESVTAARSQAATDAWGAQLTMAQPVLAQIAKSAGQEVVNSLAQQLQAGTITVAQIAAQYGVDLAGGVNPVLTALGKPPVRVGSGVGRALGQVVMNARGGLYEDHQAEIAPGGAMRVWAEPETGGEAYIPLSPSKRSRSLGIWRETGRRLRAFANGGFAVPEDVPHPPSLNPYMAPISTAGDAAMDSEYGATTQFLRENGPIGRALAWAKTQVGKPYIWGGVGPAGYDCSGFMSAITNVLLGLNPYSRRGSTANFPWPGFLAGDGAFTVGSTPNAGGGIGHMAGTLRGVNVESRGGRGVIVGGSARGAHDGLFRTRAHLGSVYHGGSEFVPRTGWAFLERGEKIIPRDANRGIPVGSTAAGMAPAVNVTVSGAQVTGTLVVDGDGIARMVDGQIVNAIVSVNRGLAAAGVR